MRRNPFGNEGNSPLSIVDFGIINLEEERKELGNNYQDINIMK